MKPFSAAGLGSFFPAVAFLLAFAFCADAQARSLSLDLSGAGGGARQAARSVVAPVDSEEVRSHRLGAGAAKISGLETGDVIAFKLFQDKTLEVTLVEKTPSLSGRAFIGRIDNSLNALGCVVLETDDGVILDITDFERRRVWQVVSDANGVVVREIEPRNDKRCCGGELAPSRRRAANVSAAAPYATKKAVAASAQTVQTAKTTVDILVNYDTDAAAWARSNGGGVTNFAETCVQKMNTALANTGLDGYFRFRLVGIYEVGGSAAGDIERALYLSCGDDPDAFGGVSWAGVAEERDRVSADIVCTLCDNGSAYGTVGLGWSLTSDFEDCPDVCGFNACLIRAVANSHTMTHEVGHNMGAGHSDKMADADNCGPQYYEYSSGYYFYVGSTGYYTIMAYNTDGYGKFYTEVPYFSSPDHEYNGVAVGTAVNDNTRTLRMNYLMVAGNRKPPVFLAEIGQGFEAENYVWTTSGAHQWSRVTDSSSDGVDSSRSCEMSGWEQSTSWTQTIVEGPASLTFMLRLRSAYGWFDVLVDDAVSYTLGSSLDVSYGDSWNSVSVAIPSGVHTVRLAYTHNGGAGYAFDGDNGAWVDSLQFAGGAPVVDGAETSGSEVPVPFGWLAAYYPGTPFSGYEALAAQKGDNGYFVWQSYVAGLDPTNAASAFKADIRFENGMPVVSYSPKLAAGEAGRRRYTVYGKKSVADSVWTEVPQGKEADFRFYTVTVELK